MRVRQIRRCLTLPVLLVAVGSLVLVAILVMRNPNPHSHLPAKVRSPIRAERYMQLPDSARKMPLAPVSDESLANKMELENGNKSGITLPVAPKIKQSDVNYNVHVFYYVWYGNPKHDKRYIHWNHEYLRHWNKKVAEKWPEGEHEPPDDIGASFYPQLGPYSSRDPAIIEQHMRWMKHAKIGVVVVSWYPPDMADENGVSWEDIMPTLLDAADTHSLKIAFHIEPYKDRSVDNLRTNIQYIITKYGKHPAFYRYSSTRLPVPKPLIYIYDSYLIDARQWQSILRVDGDRTVRGTKLDAYFVGLLVQEKHKVELKSNGFDGFYTYFGADGFTYGSAKRSWSALQVFAKRNRMIFSASVAPGYDDVRVRPWNAINSRGRQDGEYYEDHWQSAVNSNVDIVSITSFNEWHEGTQIEPAVPKDDDTYSYHDYTPFGPDHYLNLTRKWVEKFEVLANSPVDLGL